MLNLVVWGHFEKKALRGSLASVQKHNLGIYAAAGYGTSRLTIEVSMKPIVRDPKLQPGGYFSEKSVFG